MMYDIIKATDPNINNPQVMFLNLFEITSEFRFIIFLERNFCNKNLIKKKAPKAPAKPKAINPKNIVNFL